MPYHALSSVVRESAGCLLHMHSIFQHIHTSCHIIHDCNFSGTWLICEHIFQHNTCPQTLLHFCLPTRKNRAFNAHSPAILDKPQELVAVVEELRHDKLATCIHLQAFHAECRL